MSLKPYRLTMLAGLLLSLLSGTLAALAVSPALPGVSVAEKAVQDALTTPETTLATTPASTTAAPVQAARPSAAAQRAAAVSSTLALSRTRETAGSLIVKCTAYSSVPNQTDSTPFVTSTGTRVRSGIVALSRDLLQRFPYGTRLRIEDLSNPGNPVLANRVFVVEDTMHVRKVGQIDVWMGNLGQAQAWGIRQVRITPVN